MKLLILSAILASAVAQYGSQPNYGGLPYGSQANYGGVPYGSQYNYGGDPYGSQSNYGGVQLGSSPSYGDVRRGSQSSYGGVQQGSQSSYGGVQQGSQSSYGGVPDRQPAQDHHSVADYSYGYAVKDPQTGVDNTKEETRLGDRTEGSYSTVLPDGRRQIVTYWVDGDSGYNAKVTYEGVAHHPPAAPARRPVIQPVVPPRAYDTYGPGPIY